VEQSFLTSAPNLTAALTYGKAGAFIRDREGRLGFDVAMSKDLVPHENHRFEFRTEFFNITSLSDPSGELSSSAFGPVTSATDARKMKLGPRHHF